MTPSNRKGFSLLELLLALGIVAILATVTALSVSSISEKARTVECLAHVKALGVGIQRYTMDHQGFLPVRTKPVNSDVKQQWHREIWPSYRADGDTRSWSDARLHAAADSYKRWAFRCPSDRDPNSATPGLSYAMNTRLTDVRVSQVGARHILLLEMKERYMASGSIVERTNLANRHGGLNHVLFGDYRVEALKADEIRPFTIAPEIWQPDL